MKVLALSHSFQHLGRHSGYDLLFNFFDSEVQITRHENQLKGLKRKFYNRTQRLYRDYKPEKYGPFHNYNRYFTEFEAFQTSQKLNSDIIHVSHLEDSLGYLSDNKHKLKAKLIATAHQPPEWWEMTKKNKANLHALDALIVLSRKSLDYFNQVIPGKVFFVPHGVDASFFCDHGNTPKKESGKTRLLFLGNSLRDFVTLLAVIKILHNRKADVHLDIAYHFTITQQHPLFELLRYSNITWHSNLDDAELKQLYLDSDFLFLPLINSTASNALLEAACCGLPIVTSDCGGVRDYFSEDMLLLPEVDTPEAFVNTILQNMSSRKINTKQVEAYVQRNFDWKVVANQVKQVYKSV